MLGLIEARALEYSDHPGGATGLLVKDYRGKNAEREIWKFDAGLMSPINHTMKQAAIEEGQWSEKRESSGDAATAAMIIERLNAGRQRVVDEKIATLARGGIWSE